MKEIFNYNLFVFTRFKMAEYQFLPEYFAIIIMIILSTTISMGVSSEELIAYQSSRYINFNILSIYFFLFPIFAAVFMYDFYDTNYKYFKLLFPFKTKKIILIDFLIEIFSYKLLLIIVFLVLLLPFSFIYNFKLLDITSIFGFFLIITSYVSSCILIRIIKDIGKDNLINTHKNHLKLILAIFIGLFILNENTKTLPINNLKTSFFLFVFIIVIILLSMIRLFHINSKNDRVI